LRQNDLAKYFVEVRNLSQKVGYYPLSNGIHYVDESNNRHIKYFFKKFPDDVSAPVPNDDVLTACNKYFVLLLELVCDCFKNFGHTIDPLQYFDYNISQGIKSLEDIEEELGFPREWTKIEGIPRKERIRMLRQEFEKDVSIDYIFEKHLGTNRFGEKI
jgi:hypothetical protein